MALNYYSYGTDVEQSTIHKVFSVPIFETQCFVSNQEQIVEDLKSSQFETDSIGTSEFASWRTKDDLHTLDLYNPFCQKLLAAVRSIMYNVYEYEDIEPVITTMWANAVGRKGSIHVHGHSNSMFAGVWYPDSVDIHEQIKGGYIKFIDPIQTKYRIMPKIKKQNEYNSGEIMIRPQKGMLLIFPSWFEHGTVPNPTTDEIRYSISFNIWFRGNLGYPESLNRLTLQ